MKPPHLIRLDEIMRQQHLDAILCRLPENVLYLTGTLPVHGVSAAFYPLEGNPVLLQPECEDLWITPDRAELDLFKWGHLGEPVLQETYFNWFEKICNRFTGLVSRMAIEINVSVSAPGFNSAENLLPDASWQMMIAETFPNVHLCDIKPIMTSAFATKTVDEAAKIRTANQIAQLGLKALSNHLRAGMREVEAAALVESVIRIEGTGYQNARLVRGFAHLVSGPDGTFRQSMMTPSSNRVMQSGDLVMIELAVQADGYWSDLTRTYSIGRVNDAQRKAYSALLLAQKAAIKAVKAGVYCGDVDKAARDVLSKEGYGEYFIHGTGHGVGYRYHEAKPILAPGSTEVLETGMVTSIEPGIYIPGMGGIRIEDNVLVTSDGCEVLSAPEADPLPE